MSKVWRIAVREFVATVFTKGFVIGLLVVPVLGAILTVVAPRLFGERNFTIEGEIAVIDRTELVLPYVRTALEGRVSLDGVRDIVEHARTGGAERAVQDVLAATTRLTLIERTPGADVEEEKRWLVEVEPSSPRLALVVVHADAVSTAPSAATLGAYDLYVPPRQDDRIELAVQGVLRDAIVAARTTQLGLDREQLARLTTVPRVRSVTVGEGRERGTVSGLNIMVPLAFMVLLVMGVMFGGQGMLTTTVEEKSNRVVEVLLSAVSPLQLMGGKLLAHMGISLLAMSLYLGFGLIVLAAFSLFGLIDLTLIVYLLIFYLIAFFTFGSLMMAAGAAVNDMREAQSLMAPLMFVMVLPWLLWIPIVRDPSSPLAVTVSLVPPISSFGMLLRLASSTPPPAWQVWLAIALGVCGGFAALWVAAKVFRVGVLMFGKPPDFRTLIRWLRAA